MAFPISVGDIVETRLRMLFNEQQLLNVWHYRVSSGSSFDGAVDLNAALAVLDGDVESFVGQYKGFASQDVFFSRLDMQVIYPTRYITVSRGINTFGSKVGTSLPQNVQASFTKRVPLVGRSVTGRAELTGLTSDDVNEGNLAVTAIAGVAGVAAQMRATITIPDSTVVLSAIVYHRSTPVDSQAWESTQVQSTVRVARRRTVSVGK